MSFDVVFQHSKIFFFRGFIFYILGECCVTYFIFLDLEQVISKLDLLQLP